MSVTKDFTGTGSPGACGVYNVSGDSSASDSRWYVLGTALNKWNDTIKSCTNYFSDTTYGDSGFLSPNNYANANNPSVGLFTSLSQDGSPEKWLGKYANGNYLCSDSVDYGAKGIKRQKSMSSVFLTDTLTNYSPSLLKRISVHKKFTNQTYGYCFLTIRGDTLQSIRDTAYLSDSSIYYVVFPYHPYYGKNLFFSMNTQIQSGRKFTADNWGH